MTWTSLLFAAVPFALTVISLVTWRSPGEAIASGDPAVQLVMLQIATVLLVWLAGVYAVAVRAEVRFPMLMIVGIMLVGVGAASLAGSLQVASLQLHSLFWAACAWGLAPTLAVPFALKARRRSRTLTMNRALGALAALVLVSTVGFAVTATRTVPRVDPSWKTPMLLERPAP